MVFYFSGTGNSKYVAKRIAEITNDKIISINDSIKNNEKPKIENQTKLVFVTPTYAWRIPRLVKDWIIDNEFNFAKVWFVMTCGSEIGNAAKYNKEICDRKNFIYMGTAQIVMPENYIAMFGAPKWEEAEQIIAKAEPKIEEVAEDIKKDNAFASLKSSLYDRTMSGIVNGPFYKLFVNAKKYYAKENCIGCGKCVSVCPLNNIKLENNRPVWGKNCTQCMACICYCPEEAIEYGNKSKGKPRYQCKK